MLFRAGVVAWRNTTQDLNWHLFWGDVLEGWCWNTCFEEVGIEADCAYNFRDLDKLLIYINIWKFRQNSIQIILFCPTQAQNQYKSGAANNDFNFDFQHFLIISSIFFLGKSCTKIKSPNHPNQPVNQPGPTRKPIASHPQPRLTMTHPPTSIHPFQTKPVAPQLDVHEIRKMEKEARWPSCRVVSWWVGVFCYPP